MDTALAAKADKTTMDTALAAKADKTTMDTALALKVDTVAMNTALALKVDIAKIKVDGAQIDSSTSMDLATATSVTDLTTTVTSIKNGTAFLTNNVSNAIANIITGTAASGITPTKADTKLSSAFDNKVSKNQILIQGMSGPGQILNEQVTIPSMTYISNTVMSEVNKKANNANLSKASVKTTKAAVSATLLTSLPATSSDPIIELARADSVSFVSKLKIGSVALADVASDIVIVNQSIIDTFSTDINTLCTGLIMTNLNGITPYTDIA